MKTNKCIHCLNLGWTNSSNKHIGSAHVCLKLQRIIQEPKVYAEHNCPFYK